MYFGGKDETARAALYKDFSVRAGLISGMNPEGA
jgi:hypothetical protein